MRGLILAGGRATRLGPLAAQLNKSLVTVGNKPMLVRQLQQLRDHGCQATTVVVSQGSEEQVRDVIARAGLDATTRVAVQLLQHGPGRAISVGAATMGRNDGPVVVLMADTLLANVDLPMQPDTVSIGVAPAERSFCYYDVRTATWRDGVVPAGEPGVVVGAFWLSSRACAYVAGGDTTMLDPNGELGMASFLKRYEELARVKLRVETAPSWRDVGDVGALARANRTEFTSRDFHQLDATEPGVITKRGGQDVAAEVRFIENLSGSARQLFPRVYRRGISVTPGTVPASGEESWYSMEHIDMPSLAELWLYWPSRPDMWQHVACELVTQLRTKLWQATQGVEGVRGRKSWIEKRAHAMYVDKLWDRYDHDGPRINAWEPAGTVRVNGRELIAGKQLLLALTAHLRDHWVPSAAQWAGLLHGDPNFTNVLWSLRTGSFKLLDPRGEWGGPGAWGDVRYDLGKIAYSPEFAAVTHQLFTLERGEDHWELELWPERPDERGALGSELLLSPQELQVLRSYMFLSSAPLHPEPEASALYLLGVEAANHMIKQGVL